jgi:hypothetical protein
MDSFTFTFVTVSCEECKFEVAHYVIFYILSVPYIVSDTLFWNDPSLCSFFKVRDQVSHPYEATSKISSNL